LTGRQQGRDGPALFPEVTADKDMESVCPICKKPYDGVNCTNCTVTDLDVSALVASAEGLQVQNNDTSGNATAFLVDLVSNRKIPITTPKCKVGRDDLNDIVISGDQSISRFHFVISKENGQYYVQDGKSRHGTFLNGNQITGPEAIHDGDVLKVGVSLFWFVIEAAALTGSEKSTAPVEAMPALADHTGPMGEATAPTPMAAPLASLNETIAPTDSKSFIAEHAKAEAAKAEPASNEPAAKNNEDNGHAPSAASQKADTKRGHLNEDREDDIALSLMMEPLTSMPDKEDVAKAGAEPADNRDQLSDRDIARAANLVTESYAKEKSEAVTSSTQQQSAETADPKAQETLEKFANILGEVKAGEEKKAEPPTDQKPQEPPKPKDPERPPASSNKHNDGELTSNGAKSAIMSMTIKDSSSTVPDWCKKYFAGELNHLNREMNDLNDQVRHIQGKIKEVEGRVALTKGLRNVLLTAQGDDLVEACAKVLTMTGWRVKQSDEDKHELRLESDDKGISIVRIVWTEKDPDRSHLGQLSISQTRYWCEQGVEPKGILILSRVGENTTHPITPGEMGGELSEYAQKKNVCLMSTLQLLAIYKDVALNDGSTESIRNTIQNASGWLHGYHLEPGSEGDREESGSTNKLSSLLSA
jgi:pSer/pThr/pTyr-binding forkhead associated (FHA) protein